MTIGKLIYNSIYKPTGWIRYYLGHFGIRGWFDLVSGEKKMVRAARKQKPIHLSASDGVITFSFLTGKRYLHQTIFCIKSLDSLLFGQFKADIYSDGSLKADDIAELQQIIPESNIFSGEMMDKRLEELLPSARYPTLRWLREWHPFFRRMLDIHTQPGWSIHLDSDMIFFKKPERLLTAFDRKEAIYMKEQLEHSFFADDEDILSERYQIFCIRLINGGIVAYDNDLVDYDDLEMKATVLLKAYPHTSAARVEQTLMSYLLFKQNALPLPEKEYVINYDSNPDIKGGEVVKHYIFKAKLPYFKSEWKQVP